MVLFFCEKNVFFAVNFLFMILIVISDIVYFRIPDILLLTWFFFYVATSVFCDSVTSHFLAASIFLVLLSGICIFHGGFGLGDVKLVTLIALILGFFDALFVCIAACGFCMLYFIALELLVKNSTASYSKKVPFAPFLMLGYLFEHII